MTHQMIRVLCIEDGQDTCELVTYILGSKGYEVITAPTLAAASERLREGASA